MNSLINLVLTGIKLGISVWQIFARSNEIKYCITSSEFEIGLQQLRQNILNLFSCNQLLNDRKLTASCVFYTQNLRLGKSRLLERNQPVLISHPPTTKSMYVITVYLLITTDG